MGTTDNMTEKEMTEETYVIQKMKLCCHIMKDRTPYMDRVDW